jgi:hypothetical protein
MPVEDAANGMIQENVISGPAKDVSVHKSQMNDHSMTLNKMSGNRHTIRFAYNI